MLQPIADLIVTADRRIMPKSAQVFLSHIKSDKPFVRSGAEKLAQAGFKVCLDEAELDSGDSLIDRLRDEIDSVDVLLAVIPAYSVESEWVRREIEIAMTQEICNKRVKVIPVLISNVEVVSISVSKFCADCASPYRKKKALPKPIQSVHKWLKKAQRSGLPKLRLARCLYSTPVALAGLPWSFGITQSVHQQFMP